MGIMFPLQQGNNRILLVNPPYARLYKETSNFNKYPLSLGYLAACVREKSDWDVMVYNADFSTSFEDLATTYMTGEGFDNFRKNLTDVHYRIWEEVKSTVADYNPAVVGIYCCAPISGSAAMVAKIAKDFNDGILVVIGGPHPTAVGSASLDDSIDVAVRGEGENTLVDLLQTLDGKTSLDKVAGIVYRTGHENVETPVRGPIEDLDSLPFPHTHASEVLKDYTKHPKSAFSYVIASRGCPYDCFFCGSRSMWSRRVRYRSVANVTEEVKSLLNAGVVGNGSGRIEFLDDTFTLNRAYIWELCNSLIQNCPDIKWSCDTRIDRVDEELLEHMKNAGCTEIVIGIESGNNEILNHMRKRITIEEAIPKAALIKKHGIRLRANFLIGTPWETDDTMHDTLAAMRKVDGKIGYSIFTPYPGTEAFEYCKDHGLIPSDYDAALHNHFSPENHFSMNMERERFRELAAEIEEYTDKKNKRIMLEDLFSMKTIYELRASGGFRDRDSFVRLIHAMVARLRYVSGVN